MPDRHVREMYALLQEERALLQAGNLEATAALESRKRDLAKRLSGGVRPDSETLSDLQQLARRNQVLLEAAGNGVKSAVGRLREIRKATQQLDTYTRGGEVQNLRAPLSKIEHRA